jgi:hypothetical protein
MKAKNGEPFTQNCGRQAKVFFRVTYSQLWRDNGVYEDIMGFCEECARDKHAPSGYEKARWFDRCVLRQRGDVCRVVPDDGSTANDEKLRVHMNDVKRSFLRVMCTQGNAALADRWPEIFKLAWDEFQIRAVMTK